MFLSLFLKCLAILGGCVVFFLYVLFLPLEVEEVLLCFFGGGGGFGDW